MPYNKNVIFIEAPIFSKQVYKYLSDDEYAALQWGLALRPESGKIIPRSGEVLENSAGLQQGEENGAVLE